MEIPESQEDNQKVKDSGRIMSNIQKPPSSTRKNNKIKSLKNILFDFAHQIIISAIFLIIGFILLNWSAYSEIIELRINKWKGLDNGALTELVTDDKYTSILNIKDDPLAQSQQIPELNLEPSPLDNRLILPSINKNIPIIRVSSESLIKKDWGALEAQIQEALKTGVVHYPGTSLPGQKGNVVITGHSSYFPWDPGRFKDVFALLHDVEIGDKVVSYYKQEKYIYEISDIKIVMPEEIEVLKQTPEDQLTLITCTPIGTNLKRLVVTAKPIKVLEENKLEISE